ncbi:hypothetical protein ACET3Z_029093 [Daucus carota]
MRRERVAGSRPTAIFSNSSSPSTVQAPGKKQGSNWKEVIRVNIEDFEEIKRETLRFKDIMEEGVVLALEKNNTNIIRYAKNRLEQIKRCLDDELISKVVAGDIKAQEVALEKLMLTNWEGPIIKFSDKKLQNRLEKGESLHSRFIRNCDEWVDENVLNMVKNGCEEGLRMATNQAHYKSLRNMKALRNPKPEEGVSLGDRDEEARREILKYWFLLESDLVNALIKGNTSLIYEAKQEVDYLKQKMGQKLIEEGLKGEEDALCDIHSQLLKEGHWTQAGPSEIHGMYPGSKRVKSKAKVESAMGYPTSNKPTDEEIQDEANLRRVLLEKKASNHRKPHIKNSILIDFIASHSEKIEGSILKEALRGDEKAMWFALGQIHHKSLEVKASFPAAPCGVDENIDDKNRVGKALNQDCGQSDKTTRMDVKEEKYDSSCSKRPLNSISEQRHSEEATPPQDIQNTQQDFQEKEIQEVQDDNLENHAIKGCDSSKDVEKDSGTIINHEIPGDHDADKTHVSFHKASLDIIVEEEEVITPIIQNSHLGAIIIEKQRLEQDRKLDTLEAYKPLEPHSEPEESLGSLINLGKQEVSGKQATVKAIELTSSDIEDSSGSLINPVTPPSLSPLRETLETYQTQVNSVEQTQVTLVPLLEGIQYDNNDWDLKWKSREASSEEGTCSQTSASQKSVILDDDEAATQNALQRQEEETAILLSHIDKIRIKSNRGRPCKGYKKTKVIKAFKLPRRRKSKVKQMGLPVILPHNGRLDEARLVYDSALHMGLIPINSEEIQEWKTQIETDHWGAYEAIRFQEEFQQEEDVLEVLQLFNTLHSNNFQIDITERSITRIPVGQNSTAVFLARFGMENLRVFAETPGSFGEKQYWLDRDMGLLFSSAPPPNYDLGEVIDADEPSSPVELMLSRVNTELVPAVNTMWSFLALPKRVCNAIYAWF